MGWETSNRKARLPRDWSTRRVEVLSRDGFACQHRDAHGRLCARLATDVDHVVAGDDHDHSNLRALCRWHHARKSSAEGNAAQAGTRRSSRLPTEAHPLDD